MNAAPQWSWWALVPLLAIFGLALAVRSAYLIECADHGALHAAIAVQGDVPSNLVTSIDADRSFACVAPLADKVEPTAHIAPGYPWLCGMARSYLHEPESVLRWLNCALGSLTAACYFLFAWRAFHNTLVATLAGLFAALHPFWIINTAELNDGVLVGFLLSVCLLYGTRAAQQGGPFSGFLFGLSLAALVMVRAALLPFGVVALLTFLWQARRQPFGWFIAFVTLIGFLNGIVPWALRNYQQFERPVPIADSTYLHLWMGNNPRATGATLDEGALRASLPPERVAVLLDEPNQAVRYHYLAHDVWHEVEEHPTETITRRLRAALAFFLGERWFKHDETALHHEPSDTVATPPAFLAANAEAILQGTLLALVILAFLGWRWSQPWRRHGRLATIAFLWIPLPYILSHAEHLSGPRLPLDGVLICFAAFGLVSLVPGLVSQPTKDDAPR